MKPKQKPTVEIEHITPADGNVFADLGLPDAETLLLKSGLFYRIEMACRRRRWSDSVAAKELGMKRSRVAAMRGGEFHEFTVDELLFCLNKLGQDIEVVVRPVNGRKRPGKLRLVAG